ncbi:UNC93-like protein [Anabrus simplex]|uniref:UNC93-like protein n=1 Tax=Anabrus simplex TaxID=316456 RepID=UPI0035A39708
MTATELTEKKRVSVVGENGNLEDGDCNKRQQFKPAEKWRIMRNIVVISTAFMVHFTAFQGAANLQSSINDQLGTASLATIYVALILSNVFLPVVMIRWLGCKWAVAVSFIAYMPYIAAQFHVELYTLIPAALFVGFGGGPLWCGKCTYLSVVAEIYSELSGVPSEVLTIRFFGLFFMIFQFAQVWGNLISSAVFSSGATEDTTGRIYGDLSDICGANFYPQDKDSNNTNAIRPSDEKIYTVAGIYLACMVCACLIVAFGVDSLKRYNEENRTGSGTGLTGIRLLAVTLELLKEKYQLLLLPITIFLGVEQAFIGADFTASFVSCAWGISNIGYVMICYGVFNSMSAILTGWLVKMTGRVPVILGASVLHVALFITLLCWKSHSDDRVIYFVISGLWGVCDGVWLPQINAVCGILFPNKEEAAYSNFRLWESLGYIIAYAYSSYLHTYVKLYVLLANLALGIALYLVVEMSEKKKSVKVAP